MLRITRANPPSRTLRARSWLSRPTTPPGSSVFPLVAALAASVAITGCGQGSRGTGAAATDSATMAATSSNVSSNASSVANGIASTTPGIVPPAVAAIGTHGEDLYDAVKAANWTKARAITDSLDAAVSALPSNVKTAGSERQQLTAELDTLRRVVPAKQQAAALKAANRVTYLEARMTAQYRAATPAEVLLLDYYGRELEIWSAERNTAKLAQTSSDLQQTWSMLRPAIQAHGRADQATRTDSLVKSIVSAKSPGEYARLAKPLLDEVDELEKVFTKQ